MSAGSQRHSKTVVDRNTGPMFIKLEKHSEDLATHLDAVHISIDTQITRLETFLNVNKVQRCGNVVHLVNTWDGDLLFTAGDVTEGCVTNNNTNNN